MRAVADGATSAPQLFLPTALPLIFFLLTAPRALPPLSVPPSRNIFSCWWLLGAVAARGTESARGYFGAAGTVTRGGIPHRGPHMARGTLPAALTIPSQGEAPEFQPKKAPFDSGAADFIRRLARIKPGLFPSHARGRMQPGPGPRGGQGCTHARGTDGFYPAGNGI